MKYKFSLIIILILLMPIVFSEPAYVFKQNNPINLTISVFNSDNSISTDTVTCYLNVKYPNGTILLSDQAMTYNSDGSFYYFIPSQSTSILGEYATTMRCDDGTEYGFTTFTFQITPSGMSNPASGSSISFLVSVLSMFLLSLLFFFISFAFVGKTNSVTGVKELNGNPAARFGFIALSIIIACVAVFYSSVSLLEIFGGFSKIIESYSVFIWVVGSIIFIIFIFILLSLTMKAVETLRANKGLQPRRRYYR